MLRRLTLTAAPSRPSPHRGVGGRERPIYCVGSNGNGKNGKAAPERNTLYATDVSGSGAGTHLR